MAILGRTYQASDLASSERRAFLDEAKEGEARLRDTDGASLLLLPEGRYRALAGLRDWTLAYLSLEGALTRPRDQRRPSDLGQLAWAHTFDDEDLEEFRNELSEALAFAAAEQDVARVKRVVADWLRTARALSDDTARAILTGSLEDDDFVEVDGPVRTSSEADGDGRSGRA